MPQVSRLSVYATPTLESAVLEVHYVNAVNDLSTRGPEIADWAIEHLPHSDYDAREQAAFIVGQLASRDQLGARQHIAITELCALAVRSVVDDHKEIQANSAAVVALGKFGDRQAIPALRQIIQSPEWQDDELQWDSALVLGDLVGQPFKNSDNPVSDALLWLEANPCE